MATSSLTPEEYTYTKEEGLTLFVESIKGNRQCKEQRKQFNLCRSTPLGKFVEPEYCQDKAQDFINCFLKFQRNQPAPCREKLNEVVKCSLGGGNCQSSLDDYLGCH